MGSQHPGSVDEREWSNTSGMHDCAALPFLQVQVQSLESSSSRLRHAFPRDDPSCPPTPGIDSDPEELDPCRRHRKDSVEPSSPSEYFLRTLGSPVEAALSSATRWLGRINWGSQLSWIGLYFTFNLLLTLSNKSVLTKFPFPYTLTAIHALCSTLGGVVLRSHAFYTPKRLDARGELVLAAFSFLYSVNIAVSNVSLNLVTVPFHQVTRAITPIFAIALSAMLFDAHISRNRIYALIPVVFGVALATYGDYYFTAWGFFLTLFGTVLAATKTIYTSVLQSSPKNGTVPSAVPSMPEPATWRKPVSTRLTRAFQQPATSTLATIRRYLVPPSLDLHPLDLLTRMSPLAFVQCVIYAQLSGELDRLARFGSSHSPPAVGLHSTNATNTLASNETATLDCLHALVLSRLGGISLWQAGVLLLNGCIAFGLNVVSFSANGKIGPLSMTVAANIKQVLTILFSVFLFNLTITATNTLGITITLIGGAWYAWVEYNAKMNKRKGSL